MTSEFIDKVAIVTGSSSGIGEAISVKFASLGAKVTLCGRDAGRLGSVLDRLVKVSGRDETNFLIVQGDMNDARVRVKIVSQTVEKFGCIDILVGNAGTIGTNQSILTATEESYNEVMDINLKAVIFLTQQAVPYLEKSRGNIVNISSLTSDMSLPAATFYCISKTAIDELTRCLAVELGPKGVRVNAIRPGYTPTRIFRSSGFTDQNMDNFKKNERQRQALDRDGTPEDVAKLVVFLASNEAGFITGEIISVDGGRKLNGPLDMSLLGK